MKSLVIHYKNKYPKGQVHASERSIDVYDREGNHCVALRKNGAEQWVDQSEELGCVDRHDLAPIPKDARVYKACPEKGHIIEDEKSEERKKFSESERKISSIAELEKEV